MPVSFALDQRLEESSFFIKDLALCCVRLKNDTTFPWLYLVPRREGIREIFDLTREDQSLLVQEMALAGQALQTIYQPAKINTAALGNMVPQLHVHIFGRFENDPAWPRPVWAANLPDVPYADGKEKLEIQKIISFFESGVRDKKESVG